MKRETLIDEKARDFAEQLQNTRKDFFRSGMSFVENALLFCATQKNAKRFYVSAEEAVRKINNYEKYGSFGVSGKEKVRMYCEIYSRFVMLQRKWTCARTKYDILQSVVDSPAPSFYMSVSSARKLIKRYKAITN